MQADSTCRMEAKDGRSWQSYSQQLSISRLHRLRVYSWNITQCLALYICTTKNSECLINKMIKEDRSPMIKLRYFLFMTKFHFSPPVLRAGGGDVELQLVHGHPVRDCHVVYACVKNIFIDHKMIRCPT